MSDEVGLGCPLSVGNAIGTSRTQYVLTITPRFFHWRFFLSLRRCEWYLHALATLSPCIEEFLVEQERALVSSRDTAIALVHAPRKTGSKVIGETMRESTITAYDLRYGTDRFTTPDGTMLYYEVRGSGPPLTIINNFFIIAPLWRNFTRTLEKSHTIITFDLRNQGASSPVDGEIEFRSLVEDVGHVLDHLRIPQTYLIATSTSTLIARDFALAHPERVKGMALVGPLFCPYGSRRRKFLTKSWLASLDRAGVAGLFEHIFPLIYSDRTIESGGTPAYLALRERFTAVNSQNQLEQFLRASLTTDDDPAKLRQLDVPVKLIVGEADFLQSPSSLAAVVGLLPRGTFDVVPHAGHVPYFEATEYFERSIASFTADIENAGGERAAG